MIKNLSASGASIALALLLAACSSGGQTGGAAVTAGPSDLQSDATSKQVMLGLTIPAADVIWGVGSQEPADDAEWDRVVGTAVMLAESGLMLLQPPRNVAQDDWTQSARDLIKHARAAADAARAHDADAVLAAGDEIYAVCDACHNTYMPAKVAEQAGAEPE
ncbi:MAG: hypothetical protein LBE59_02950 [Nevskiaceae bacterium]|nr:hypothetical protein [Nevskiaceae bacterium]